MRLEKKNLPKRRSLRIDQFTAELQQTFKAELTLTLLKLFHKIESEGSLVSHSINPVLP